VGRYSLAIELTSGRINFTATHFLKEGGFCLTASTWSPLFVYKNNDSLFQRSYEIRKGNEVYWKTVPLKHTGLTF